MLFLHDVVARFLVNFLIRGEKICRDLLSSIASRVPWTDFQLRKFETIYAGFFDGRC